MSTIQQRCPSCGRMLELPATAAGQLAKCPACEATFTAGNDAGASAQTSGENPYNQPLGAGQLEDLAGGRPAGSTGPGGLASDGGLPVVHRPIEEIFSPTLSIFAARYGPLLLAFLIVIVVAAVILGVPFLILSVMTQSGGDLVAALGFLFMVPISILVGCYLSVGLARNAIAVARNTPAPLRELIPPLEIVLRFIVAGVAIGSVFATMVGIYVATIVGYAAGGGDQAAAMVLSFVGSGIILAVTVLVYWLLWSWMFVVSDGQTTAFGSIRLAYRLTVHNKLTSIFLVLIATVLSTIGTLAGGVGLIVAQPLINLLFAVGYLRLTNQAIDDPKAADR